MIETRIDGRLVERLPVETISSGSWGPGLLWVDAVAPSEEELEYLVRAFEIHPLAEEDIRHRNQRPKVDEYGDRLFIVVFGAGDSPSGSIELREVHLLVGPRSLLSVSDSPVHHVAAVGERCALRPELAAGDPGSLLYRLVDGAVDSFIPVIDHLEEHINDLETRILERPDAALVGDIFDFKRDLTVIRRLLAPQRDLLQGLAGPHGPALGQEAQLYLRDVYDHAVRLVEEIDAARDIVTGALDVYLSSLSNRLGEQTRRLSVVATIFLPLTFFTGFFGQNFAFLVDKISTTEAFAVGISIEVVSVVIIWLTIRALNERARAVPRAAHRHRTLGTSLRLRARAVRSRVAPAARATTDPDEAG